MTSGTTRSEAGPETRASARLSAANRAALAQVRASARREAGRHMRRIAAVLKATGVDADPEAVLQAASVQGVLTINFHPDRLLADGRPVAAALRDDGVYRSQFETRISNGGLTGHPGGDRDRWEESLFAGAYQAPAVLAGERPKYGGLNLINHRNGACPRFGSCHLELRRDAVARATLIFGDSAAWATDIGLAGAFAAVRAPLNDYIEAQIHGVVSLAADVDALVIDPAFGGTPTEEALLAAADRHGFALRRHAGSALPLAEVPREMPETAAAEPMRWQHLCGGGRAHRLAERVVADPGTAARLDPATIGRAAVEVVREPRRRRQWGEEPLVLQHLKDLWLLVVAHGGPLDDGSRDARGPLKAP
jgi:hypothetical protein